MRSMRTPGGSNPNPALVCSLQPPGAEPELDVPIDGQFERRDFLGKHNRMPELVVEYHMSQAG
jgi:hypothetical protein